MIMRRRHYSVLLAVLLALTAPTYALAQSTTHAPPLDTHLRNMIEAMRPLTESTITALTDKPVMITFFASWCPPCRPEFKEINRLRQEFSSDEIEIIAINIFEAHFNDNRQIRMKRFLRSTAPRFPVLRPKNEQSAIQKLGAVDRIPTVFLYDALGQPRYTFIHQKDATKTHIMADEIRPHIEAILNK